MSKIHPWTCEHGILQGGDQAFGVADVMCSGCLGDKVVSDGWSTSYYELPAGAKELQDLIEYKEMNFARGNIFKAAYRLGEKSGADAEYDLTKILWYAKRELERIRDDT